MARVKASEKEEFREAMEQGTKIAIRCGFVMFAVMTYLFFYDVWDQL